MKNHIQPFLIVLLFLSCTAMVLPIRARCEVTTAVSDIEVKLKRDNFKIGQDLEGEIDIFNNYPAAVPIMLKIKIQHENEDVFDSLLAIKIFPGSNRYPLEIFNIPPLFNDDDAVGQWRLFVGDRNGDNYRTVVDFQVKN